MMQASLGRSASPRPLLLVAPVVVVVLRQQQTTQRALDALALLRVLPLSMA
jgi:hypothetical protein